jgi:hypothetical protein
VFNAWEVIVCWVEKGIVCRQVFIKSICVCMSVNVSLCRPKDLARCTSNVNNEPDLWWLTPVILATWEAEICRIRVQGQQRPKDLWDPHLSGEKLGLGARTCHSTYIRKPRNVGITAQDDLGKKQDPLSKITRAKRAEDMAQVLQVQRSEFKPQYHHHHPHQKKCCLWTMELLMCHLHYLCYIFLYYLMIFTLSLHYYFCN